MEIEIDHYQFLGLPSGEEGSKLTLNEISKAYRLKALELHPDKRPDDPDANTNFQKLKSSYEILKDEKARKLFDDLLRVKREQRQRQSQYDSKRRRMMSDLEERERASFAPDQGLKAKQEEERIVKKFREEIERIRAMHANKNSGTTRTDAEVKKGAAHGSGGVGDEEKVLKVSWEGNEGDYSSQRLRELFQEFGEVEDVVIRSRGSKRSRAKSALVVMASKDAAVSAMGSVCGDLSNPLLVMPLKKAPPTEVSSPFPARHVEPDDPVVNNLVGASYQAKEASILEKLRKALYRTRCSDSGMIHSNINFCAMTAEQLTQSYGSGVVRALYRTRSFDSRMIHSSINFRVMTAEQLTQSYGSGVVRVCVLMVIGGIYRSRVTS